MYKIVRCHNCKTFAMTSADVAFKCLKCSKTIDITKMKIFFSSDSPQITTKVLQKIKMEEFKQKRGEDGVDEFM